MVLRNDPVLPNHDQVKSRYAISLDHIIPSPAIELGFVCSMSFVSPGLPCRVQLSIQYG